MNRILGTFDYVVEFLMIVGELVVALLCLHIVVQVIASAVFASPIEGTDAIVSYWYMVPIVFLPLAYIQRRDEHIKAEIFTDKLGPTSRLVLDVVIMAALLVYCGLLLWQTSVEAIDATRMNESIELVASSLIAWPSRWFVPVGFLAMGIAVLLMLIQRLVSKSEGKSQS